MTTNDSTAAKKSPKRRTAAIADQEAQARIEQLEREAQERLAQAEAEAQARIEELEAQMNKLKEQESEVTVTMTLRATKGKREQMKARAAQRGMSLQAAYDRGADLFLAEEF